MWPVNVTGVKQIWPVILKIWPSLTVDRPLFWALSSRSWQDLAVILPRSYRIMARSCWNHGNFGKILSKLWQKPVLTTYKVKQLFTLREWTISEWLVNAKTFYVQTFLIKSWQDLVWILPRWFAIIPSPGAKRRPRAEGPKARVLISTGV